MRCHWANDKVVGRFWFPGCMGGAVYGPNGCTCQRPSEKKRQDDIERRLDQLEDRMRKLEAKHG